VRAARVALAFLRRDLLIEASYRANFLFGLSGLLLRIGLFFFLARMVARLAPGLGEGYFPFVLSGLAVSELMAEALHGFGRRVRAAQTLGTLEAVLATPISPAEAILSPALLPLGAALARGGVYLGVALLATANAPSPLQLITGAAAYLVGAAVFVALGVLSASLTLLLKRGDPLGAGLAALSTLLSGVYYPVSVLPAPLQSVAQWLPMTHALEALRAGMGAGGGVESEGGRAWLILSLLALGLLPLSLLAFAAATRRARREGSLCHY